MSPSRQSMSSVPTNKHCFQFVPFVCHSSKGANLDKLGKAIGPECEVLLKEGNEAGEES